MQITKDLSIGQVLAINPGTATIFMRHGMHCLGCPYATGESIEEAAEVHGTDAEALIKALNDYVENSAN